MLVVFEENLQVSTSWLRRNLCDLGGRVGITQEVGWSRECTGPWSCFRTDKAGLSSTTWQEKKTGNDETVIKGRVHKNVEKCNLLPNLPWNEPPHPSVQKPQSWKISAKKVPFLAQVYEVPKTLGNGQCILETRQSKLCGFCIFHIETCESCKS